MQEPSLHLPRGVLVGSTLAIFMIVPLVAAIALDSGFGWRGGFLRGQTGIRAGRPFAKSSCDFFDGKIRLFRDTRKQKEPARVPIEKVRQLFRDMLRPGAVRGPQRMQPQYRAANGAPKPSNL